MVLKNPGVTGLTSAAALLLGQAEADRCASSWSSCRRPAHGEKGDAGGLLDSRQRADAGSARSYRSPLAAPASGNAQRASARAP